MSKKQKAVSEIGKLAIEAIQSLVNKKPESVVSISKEAKGWKAVLDVLERRAVPDTQDLLGRYELTLNEEGELLGYKQVVVRRRQDRLGIEFIETNK